MRLTHALVASDLNAGYVDFWPLVRRAWREVAGLEAVLVLVADSEQVPAALLADDQVRLFEPVDRLYTAFQAQCIRMLYPALLETEGAVLTADVDMLPLSRDYFHRPVSRVGERDFVAYRDVLLPIAQIPICYNAALPETWCELFDVHTSDDVRSRLATWGNDLAFDGVRGGAGWDTDQEILYRTLLRFGAETRRVWLLDDRYTGFRRLERAELRKPRLLNAPQARRLRRGGYSDYHALPQAEFRELNEQILALAAARQRPSRRTT